MTGPRRALPFGLAVLFATLCAVIGLEIVGQPQEQQREPAARVTSPARGGRSALTETPNQHDVWFKEIVSRPLFSPDRKPAGSEAREVRGLPRLTGIVMDGSRRVAIFAGSSGGRATVVEAGSRVGTYDVRDITDTGVTVVGPEGPTVIRPIFDMTPAAPGRPPAAVRPELPKPGGR